MVRLDDVSLHSNGICRFGPSSLIMGDTGITAIIGPNGSGKSSFLRLLHGLEVPTSGEIRWSKPIDVLDQAFLFQAPVLLRRSVFENLELPFKIRGLKSDIKALSEQYNLQDVLNVPALTLSGGEKQKLALARALSQNPKLLFLDEPTANLDRPSTRAIEAIVTKAVSNGTRVLIASHSMAQVRRIANDVVYIQDGVADGPFATNSFFDSPPELAADWMRDGL